MLSTEIHVRLPEIMKSKNLKVKITNNSIDIFSNLENRTLLTGTLSEKCKAADAMWTIVEGNKLNICLGKRQCRCGILFCSHLYFKCNLFIHFGSYFVLDKTKEIWWKKLFTHEKEIDVSKLDCSRPMNELSQESQSYIQKIEYDEQQKLQGEQMFRLHPK